MEAFQHIKEALEKNGVFTEDDKIKLLADYLTELLRVNEFMNLTAVKDVFEASYKNIADCAVCARYIEKNSRLLDIGSGAGLPAFPFAILRPDIKVTALDSTAKKVNFINETARLLGLDNLTAINARAEAAAKSPEYRERFDTVSARAVARLNILCELSIPFLKKGGHFISMKSRLAGEELEEAKNGIRLLGGRVKKTESFSLLGLSEPQERNVIIIEKLSPSPKQYPREYRVIASKPL